MSPMKTEISEDWTYQGFRVVRLEAGDLRVDVLPELGGKILSIYHAGIRREFLWRNPRLRLRRVPIGTSYDDHFFGGLDDNIPNDQPERFCGENLVDHGELWTLPLSSRIEGKALVLEGDLPITPIRYRRRVEIEPPETIRLDYRLQNIGGRQLKFLWKLHPALRISEGAQVEVPARKAEVAEPAWSRFGGSSGTLEFPWPNGTDAYGKPLRADLVPALDGRSTEFLCLSDLERGEAGLVHPKEGWAFRMRFPAEILRSVWLFASYRGWREHGVLVLEPSTNWPVGLAEASTRGQSCRLGPGEVLIASIQVTAGKA